MTIVEMLDKKSVDKLLIWCLNEAVRTKNREAIMYYLNRGK